MNLLTEPVTKQPRMAVETQSTTQWLDALATGTCDQDTFLRGVGEILQRAPDAGWELLALVDQYYRRGKINAESFGSVKTHLQSLLMGKGRGSEASFPSLQEFDDQPDTTAESHAAPVSNAYHGTTTAMLPPSAALSEPVTPARPDPAPAVPGFEAPRSLTGAPPGFTPTPSFTPATPQVGSVPAAAASASPNPFSGRRRVPLSEPIVPIVVRPRAASVAPSAVPSSAPPPIPPTAAPPTGLERGAVDASRQGPERSLAVGDVLRGRYRVQSLLGQGGMGTVFEAIDLYRLDRSNGDQKVAIKVLHTAVIQRPRLFAELRREFQHLQSLSHPNIVRVHEFDRDGDTAFFTMEYLSGSLLNGVLAAHETTPLHRPYALAIIRDVGAAVAHAHARGVVHGDLNPGNIFITDNGEVRVLDFGAAHQLRRTPWISEFESTQQIAVATTSYASCQLLEGETADVRDDIYAMSCIIYVLLTGNLPFGEHSALKARTLRLTPERPAGLGRRQWGALRAGLQFARDRRPSDVQAWLDRLDLHAAEPHLPILATLMTRHPQRRTGMRWAAIGSAAALIAAGVWWAATHGDAVARASDDLRAQFSAILSNNAGDIRVAETPDNPAPLPEAAPEQPAAQPVPAKPMNAARAAPHAAVTVAPPQGASAAPATTASSGGSNGAFGPSGSPLHARIELAADNIDVAPTEPMAHVVVRRSRTLRGDVSFSWWTESGTAKPGRDFVAVKTHVEHIEDGKNSVNLTIPILTEPGRHDPRSFYVVIDEASDNAALGARTLSMVTIPGTG